MLIARANRTRKSRYNILPPTGTRAKYISTLIKHNALPFIGNFCANSGDGSSPSYCDRVISHCHTSARDQSRGSVWMKHKIRIILASDPNDYPSVSPVTLSHCHDKRCSEQYSIEPTDWKSVVASFCIANDSLWTVLNFVPSVLCLSRTHANIC